MKNSRLSDDESARELQEAGYTSAIGAVAFCLITAGVGAVLGSVYLGIAFNVLFGQEWESINTLAGITAGALAAGGIALFKIRQGNLEARERVEDAAWRRLVREGRHPEIDRR